MSANARRPISDRPRSAEGNENLAYLLDREVRAIGPETMAAPPARDIRLLVSPSGSYRYVGLDHGRPVSALQIMSRDGIRGVIANVYTSPAFRRRGWAKKLLDAARGRFREVRHADDLSPAGAAWKSAERDPSTEDELEAWAEVIADAVLEGHPIDTHALTLSERRALLLVAERFRDEGDQTTADALTRASGNEFVVRRLQREHWKHEGIYPQLWESTTYASPRSRTVVGRLHVEGRTRQDALDLLQRLAESAAGAAGSHARFALSGRTRHALTPTDVETAYAAQDGFWRGWSYSDWAAMPPLAYSRWL